MTTEQTTQDAAHMAEIGHLLRTQDNRATDVPIFIVQEQRRLYGLDPAYADDGGIVWLDCENDHAEVDAEEHARLEKLHDEGEDVPGKWTRTAYRDEWHFVTACFTEAGCNEYIRVNGHNHRGKLRVYAAGSWRNEEWRSVYRFLRQIGEAPGHVSIPRRTLEKLVDATRRNHDVREAREAAEHVLLHDALRYEPARTDAEAARRLAKARAERDRLEAKVRSYDGGDRPQSPPACHVHTPGDPLPTWLVFALPLLALGPRSRMEAVVKRRRILHRLLSARRRAHAAEAELELLRRQIVAVDAEDRDAAGEPRS